MSPTSASAAADFSRQQRLASAARAAIPQVGRSRPGARAIVTELMRQWQQQLAQGMLALQAKGLVSPDLDADRTAAALLAGIQGGVTMMMSTGDSTHLRAALDTDLDYLRAWATDAGDA